MQSTDGAITYAETSYTAADSLQSAVIQNAAGNFEQPTAKAVLAAAAAGTTRPDGTIKLVDPPASAADAYPLASYTYVIVPKVSPKANIIVPFLKYADQPDRPGVRSRRLPAPALRQSSRSNQTLIAKIHS